MSTDLTDGNTVRAAGISGYKRPLSLHGCRLAHADRVIWKVGIAPALQGAVLPHRNVPTKIYGPAPAGARAVHMHKVVAGRQIQLVVVVPTPPNQAAVGLDGDNRLLIV